MRLIKYSLIFILIISSCSEDPTRVKQKKKDMIEKEKLVNILADIHLMDAVTNSAGYFRRYDPGDSVDLYSSIFRKYGVTKAEFDTTIAIYTRIPEVYLGIYDEVILELNLRIDSLNENQPRFEKEEEQ